MLAHGHVHLDNAEPICRATCRSPQRRISAPERQTAETRSREYGKMHGAETRRCTATRECTKMLLIVQGEVKAVLFSLDAAGEVDGLRWQRELYSFGLELIV